MIDRRFALTGLVATGATAAIPSQATSATEQQGSSVLPMGLPAPIVGPRMNRSRVIEIMDRLGLDALVLGQGINLYHASGIWPISTRMGHAPTTIAIVMRDESQPLSMVASSFTYYYQLADAHRSEDFPVYQFTAPGGPEDENGIPAAAPVSVFRNRNEAPMDAIEESRTSLTQLAADDHGAWAGAKFALAKAFKDLGLEKATVAADHPTVWSLVADAAPNATIVDSDEALRRIRMVKSDVEITLMRQASGANVAAAHAAARAVRAGATYQELRATFFAEAARRGNRGVFMVVDRVSSEQFDAPFRDGQAFLIDAVSEHGGYHGDYGRTVFLGEPARAMAHATKMIGTAWDEVRNALKPGMKFSEISALGQSTLKKLGADYTVSFGPHSVGLYHTDHVGNTGAAAYREDYVLEKGMIISVDCPLLEAGMGGSAHLEDLMLITDNGSEPIHDVGDHTILI